MIERELGGGGMSRVFLAEETALGRRVVIKVLPPDLAHALSGERFRQEIRLAARLNHPHIVPLLAAGESDGVPYYTMPFVEGESLRARLARGPLPVAEALDVLGDVAKALGYAHEHGVVHRDIKPDNVLLSGSTAAVSDFGVAKAVTAASTGIHGGLTSLGVVLGTPAYMAPEQGAGDPATDHRADIYAFGCLAYESLAGTPPFADRPPAALLAAHMIDPPEPILARRPDLPQPLASLVMRCLAKRPADRPADAAELLTVLATVSPPREPATIRLRPAGGRTRRWLPAGVAGAVSVIVVLAVIFGMHRRPADGGSVGAPTLHSVAVLPFENTGGDPKDEYFSDGMTDELAHALATLPELRVAGRTSSYSFKGKSATVQDIGRQLGVAGVIAGSVRRAGDRLRVTVQLSSASDGFERWSHQYESRSADVFQVQDSLTHAIVSELVPALDGDADGGPGGQQGTTDAAAYEHYLRGHYFWSRRGATGLQKAIGEFRAAVARDPNFARAYAGMALAYGILRSYTTLNADSVNSLALASARRALALDSTLAEAHLALATGFQNRIELAPAEAEFRRAVALAPSSATAHQWLATNLAAQGRIDQALPEVRGAVTLDPLSAVAATDYAVILLAARRYPEAAAAARRGLDLDSTFTFGHAVLAQIYGVSGKPDSALIELGLGDGDDPYAAWLRSAVPNDVIGWRGLAAWAYAAAGRDSDAEQMRARIAADPRASGYEQALAGLAVGDHDGAVAGLARGFASHEILNDEETPGCSPVFDPLHQLASFRSLMLRYGIWPCGS